MNRLRLLASHLWGSAVAWSWLFNGLRVGSALLLLPLLVRLLGKSDLGMHYVLLSLGALAMMVDFGFAGAIWRAVCIALAGGKELRAEGLAPPAGPQAAPNHELLWDVLATTRRLYLGLAMIALLLLGAGGTLVVARHAQATSSPEITWLAWALTLALAVWEVYAGWWSTYLAALNRVVTAARLNCLAHGLKLLLAAGLLLAGLGLLALPLAGLVATGVQRLLARRACLQVLSAWPPPKRSADTRGLLRVLWPNSWRQGVIGVGSYLGANSAAFISLELFGLAATAQFGLSLQLVAVAQSMAASWTAVKWPEIAQHCARGDHAAMRRVFQLRLWLQLVTFLALAAVLVPCAQPLLNWLGSNKEVLPLFWFALLALNAFFDMQFSAWGTLISTGNRIPVMWPALLGTLAGLALALAFIANSSFGLGALVLGPLLAGSAFNYWYWPAYGARFMGTPWPRFMFQRQT
jgi:O-antigen/teichoic acid export membrane protein